MRAPVRPFSRQYLLERCLPESEALERVVDTHIYNLRKKLEGGSIRRVSQRSRRGLQVQTAMMKTRHSLSGAGFAGAFWRWPSAA
jgi:DNA-binding response OmpR family regulator